MCIRLGAQLHYARAYAKHVEKAQGNTAAGDQADVKGNDPLPK
jgi:hypothetical protein